MRTISKGMVQLLREQYPKGTRVELEVMNDPWTTLSTGDQGTVMCVDDMGTIHVAWDCGSRLGVVFGEDSCRKVED